MLKGTGWPIGLVIHTHDGAHPTVTETGIELRVSHRGNAEWTDYWSLGSNGDYYFIRLFEEETTDLSWRTSVGHPPRPLWFDIRVWRITETLLHSAALYRELGVPPDEPYVLAINHLGLEGREFWTSEAGRFIDRGFICKAESASWRREVTQDVVQGSLHDLVRDVSSRLFALFDFATVGNRVINEISEEFLRRSER
jgi:hypothetical protein